MALEVALEDLESCTCSKANSEGRVKQVTQCWSTVEKVYEAQMSCEDESFIEWVFRSGKIRPTKLVVVGETLYGSLFNKLGADKK